MKEPYISVGFSKANWKRFKKAVRVASRDEPFREIGCLSDLIQEAERRLELTRALNAALRSFSKIRIEGNVNGKPISDIHDSIDSVSHDDSERISPEG